MEKNILIGHANREKRKVVQREYSRTEMERGVPRRRRRRK